jgi:hypothetical protein
MNFELLQQSLMYDPPDNLICRIFQKNQLVFITGFFVNI